MDLAAILFLIAVLLAVSLYLVTPLMNGRSRRVTEETQEVSSLLAERERLLNALQELDFDFQLGKVPEEDYPSQRAELLQKGADVLKKLDVLAPARTPARPRKSASAMAHGSDLNDDEIESMLAARRKERKTKAAGFCPRCGKPVLVTDQFCPNCGKAL
jgi:hypothetical protein